MSPNLFYWFGNSKLCDGMVILIVIFQLQLEITDLWAEQST